MGKPTTRKRKVGRVNANASGVNLAEIRKNVEAVAGTTLDQLLDERGKTHGDFGDHARASQLLKDVVENLHTVGLGSSVPTPAVYKLSHVQRESIDMILHKIGRILAGDPDFRDHWDDIAGYAKLAADRCKPKS